ncbi:chemoreceptor glutamine deamidase CheD [Spongiibacter sp. KMU-158]|uniref:Probable chemoreceptor glutamine deamidase CheD n=1 Tax=Spongiibacter pelagi TaxID=2760804 RepID=A0A927C271_9GAMM|nr:chemoreceptor glutamine deamidase CheD [Spongiibacter pelagi]MBD2858130.1 chemoreceptor glutamine deamidase CheD [Spongiibacter pelagi]
MSVLMAERLDRKSDGDYPDIHKHWDSIHGVYAARVLPGQYYVTNAKDEMISTVLGSCIAACIRDRVLNIGGLNHFMLPEGEGGMDGVAARYGTYAMEHLINDILKKGGKRQNLEIKIFGGGKIMKGITDIGAKNIRFIKQFLATEGLVAEAEDLGLEFSRKVNYFPSTGRVLVKRLRSLHLENIASEEAAYSRNLKQESVGNDIELFD